jgi:transcriptional regulator with XRE-family HTH domain
VRNRVGGYLRAARKRLGRSLPEMAATTGLSQASLSRYETGQQRVSLEVAQVLAPAYGVALSDLLRAAGLQPPLEFKDDLPADPMGLLTRALAIGPWPENVSAAVYALLVAVMDDRRDKWERRLAWALSRQHPDLGGGMAVSVTPLTAAEQQEVRRQTDLLQLWEDFRHGADDRT